MRRGPESSLRLGRRTTWSCGRSSTVADSLISATSERRAKQPRVPRYGSRRAVLESPGDDHGLALYWWSSRSESWFRCRAEDTATACERALAHLRISPT